MNRTLALVPVALLVLLSLPIASAKPEAGETNVVSDTADDFQGNGGLDILAVNVVERYDSTFTETAGADVVQFRIELRNLGDLETLGEQTKFIFVVGYTVGGVAKEVRTTATQMCPIEPPPGGSGPNCGPLITTQPHFSFGNNFFLVTPASDLPNGTVLEHIWAATATVTPGDQTIYQDVAPGDTQSKPTGIELVPPTTGISYTTQGTFPFLRIGEMSPAARPINPGRTQDFFVQFNIDPSYASNDVIQVTFGLPVGWTVETNLGLGVAVSSSSYAYDYRITIKAPIAEPAGTTVTIPMDAVLANAGGHVTQDFVLAVTKDTHVEYAEFQFAMAQAGPFSTESETPLRFTIQRSQQPLVRYKVQADFVKDNAVMATQTASYVENGTAPGTYEVRYKFPDSGQWTVDVYVAELEPAPSQEFVVTVAGEDSLPGFDAAFVVVAGLALVLARRRLGA